MVVVILAQPQDENSHAGSMPLLSGSTGAKCCPCAGPSRRSREKRVHIAIFLSMTPCAGIVGLPNVGKSSLINSLKRKHAAPTGNTPGVTTTVQEVHLDKKITLLDSPGVVFSAAGNAHAALLNCTKVKPLSLIGS